MKRNYLRIDDRSNVPAGFSLLEVILALFLSVFVILGIASAIRVNVVMLEQQQRKIEYAQVGRSIIQVIARDLRAALQHKPADVSGLQEIMAGSDPSSLLAGAGASLLGDLAGGDSGGAADGGIGDALSGDFAQNGATGGLDGGGLDAGGLDAGGLNLGAGAFGDIDGGGGHSGGADPITGVEQQSGPTAAEDCEVVPCHPGLYGSANHVVVDVSHLPRIDEWVAQTQLDGEISIPSDVKTVSYYVEAASENEFVSYTLEGEHELGGLFRRSADRAVASYAFQAGSDLLSIGHRELIAPEVAQIQFRYFDGVEWVTEWDSDIEGGFPSAVEIVVVIDPARVEVQNLSEYQFNGFNNETMLRYRSVVYLPVAEIVEEESAEGE